MEGWKKGREGWRKREKEGDNGESCSLDHPTFLRTPNPEILKALKQSIRVGGGLEGRDRAEGTNWPVLLGEHRPRAGGP